MTDTELKHVAALIERVGDNAIEIAKLRADVERLQDMNGQWATIATESLAEAARLHALINMPQTDDFVEAMKVEAAHQVERWGVEHDAGKRPEDWIALVVYLLGKATNAHFERDGAKLLHHVITLAAVALNWHRNMTGESTAMRPGIGPASELWAECHEPPDVVRGLPPCGWTGEMSMLVDRGALRCCPSCGSTAIKEDITP